MKKTGLIFCLIGAIAMMTTLQSEAKTIKLPAANLNRETKSVMETFQTRKSIRAYSNKMLSDQDLSDLLWAAQGLTHDGGRMTSPTARNSQEIMLFVFMEDGVYQYDHYKHILTQVKKGDHREILCGGQAFAKTAPIVLLMVADFEKYGKDTGHARAMVFADAGICSENVNLFCTAAGLCTVPRGIMDREAISALLGLNEKQIPVLNNPVGYPKK